MDENTWFALIFSNPNRSDARLMFADWLGDQGESDRPAILRQHSEWPMLNRQRKTFDANDGVVVVAAVAAIGVGVVAIDGDDAAVGGDGAESSINSIKVTEMKTGEWYIVARQSRYYYHILIGQVIVEGWEITMPQARSIRRIGSRDIVALSKLGPDNGLALREVSHECLFRPELERVILTKAELWEGVK